MIGDMRDEKQDTRIYDPKIAPNARKYGKM